MAVLGAGVLIGPPLGGVSYQFVGYLFGPFIIPTLLAFSIFVLLVFFDDTIQKTNEQQLSDRTETDQKGLLEEKELLHSESSESKEESPESKEEPPVIALQEVDSLGSSLQDDASEQAIKLTNLTDQKADVASDKKPDMRIIFSMIKDPNLMILLAVSGIANLGITGLDTILPLYLDEHYDFSPSTIGWIFATITVAFSIGSPIFGKAGGFIHWRGRLVKTASCPSFSLEAT